MNKSDPELQAVGLTYWDYNYDALIHDKKTLKLMYKTSEKLAQLSNPSLTTLKYLLEVCSREKGSLDCDADKIMAKQMALYPDDAVVYLAPLQYAMNDGNEADVFYLINQMAKANSVQFSTYDSKKLHQELENYMLRNPHSEEGIEYFLNDYIDYFFGTAKPTKAENQYMRDNLADYLSVVAKLSLSWQRPLPSIRPFLQACEQYKELKAQCLDAAKIFYETGDSYLSQMIALAVAEKVHLAQGASALAKAVQNKQDKLKDTRGCLTKKIDIPQLIDGSYQLFLVALDVGIEAGEWAALKHHASLIYENELRVNPDTAHLLNPEMCFEGISEHGFLDAFKHTQ
ncbi:hypothetical protein OS175_07220 [Marinicella sp. S1101]|uniref:hypothetical protein n=1 Tax=Marinicella marina TaxID=2996016 RepID=UPI002260FDA2|nr:hypothetical protein [Marinicella marina]MCX7553664.1 hypothetical protein [Marinicella marina]MDJ1140288.1 hypothetical protein [Marinicella marina]